MVIRHAAPCDGNTVRSQQGGGFGTDGAEGGRRSRRSPQVSRRAVRIRQPKSHDTSNLCRLQCIATRHGRRPYDACQRQPIVRLASVENAGTGRHELRRVALPRMLACPQTPADRDSPPLGLDGSPKAKRPRLEVVWAPTRTLRPGCPPLAAAVALGHGRGAGSRGGRLPRRACPLTTIRLAGGATARKRAGHGSSSTSSSLGAGGAGGPPSACAPTRVAHRAHARSSQGGPPDAMHAMTRSPCFSMKRSKTRRQPRAHSWALQAGVWAAHAFAHVRSTPNGGDCTSIPRSQGA